MGLKGLANRPFQCQANVLKISGWPILTGGCEKCAGIMRAAFLGSLLPTQPAVQYPVSASSFSAPEVPQPQQQWRAYPRPCPCPCLAANHGGV